MSSNVFHLNSHRVVTYWKIIVADIMKVVHWIRVYSLTPFTSSPAERQALGPMANFLSIDIHTTIAFFITTLLKKGVKKLARRQLLGTHRTSRISRTLFHLLGVRDQANKALRRSGSICMSCKLFPFPPRDMNPCHPRSYASNMP